MVGEGREKEKRIFLCFTFYHHHKVDHTTIKQVIPFFLFLYFYFFIFIFYFIFIFIFFDLVWLKKEKENKS